MSLKQEALRVIREELGDNTVTYNTSLTDLVEEYEINVETLVEKLENEFGVELSEEYLVDIETVGELCQLVARSGE